MFSPTPKLEPKLGTTSAQQSSKKLIIKNKRTIATSKANNSNTLSTLKLSLNQLFADQSHRTPLPYQSLYALCEGYVNSSNDAQNDALYAAIHLQLEQTVTSIVHTLQSSSSSSSSQPQQWLTNVNDTLKSFFVQVLLMRSIFLSLDRNYILKRPSLLPLWDLSISTLNRHISDNIILSQQLTDALSFLVTSDRDRSDLSISICPSILSQLSLISPSLHHAIFYSPFLQATKSYYSIEADRLLTNPDQMSTWDYLAHVQNRLKSETERCQLLLVNSSEIVDITLNQLMRKDRASLVLERGLPTLMNESRLQDIHTLASLLQRVNLSKSFQIVFQSHLKKLALESVMPPTSDAELVQSLLNLKAKSDDIVIKLKSIQNLSDSQKDAFEWAINSRENKPAECIARYIDQKMRIGNKEMNDEEMEIALNGALWIFRLAQGKDVFEAHFQRDLARRLLLNKSASVDTERRLLLKLREECGAGWTSRLETMFKDVDVSNDFMKLFKHHFPTLDVHVYVLSMGNWPSYPAMEVQLPLEMQRQLDKFQNYYISKHSGRKLHFQHSLTSVTLKVKFQKGSKELNLALSQCVVMLLFENKREDERIGYQSIKEETKLEEKELKRTLLSLASGKLRVLTKHPKGRDVEETDEFSFNHLFKDEHYRLKINQIQLKESTEETEKTNERVLQDRRPFLEAAIVRILKSRKTLKHSDLIMELVGQIKDRFKVDMTEVKKAIDSLIEREYMERAEGKRDVYNYLA